MFIEHEFEDKRPEEINRLIRDFPLASIVINTEAGLMAEHVPLMLNDKGHLFGHVSLNNSLYTHHVLNGQALCIF